MRTILCPKGHKEIDEKIIPGIREKFVCKKCKRMFREDEMKVVETEDDLAGVIKATGSMTKENVVKALRDMYFLAPIEEGIGGEVGYNCPGFPGTGMRRPGGCFHGLPGNIRTKILRELKKAGWIVEENGSYAATEAGKAILQRLDTCPECNAWREAYIYESWYKTEYTVMKDKHIVFLCEHDMKARSKKSLDAMTGLTMSNFGSSMPVKIRVKLPF